MVMSIYEVEEIMTFTMMPSKFAVRLNKRNYTENRRTINVRVNNLHSPSFSMIHEHILAGHL